MQGTVGLKQSRPDACLRVSFLKFVHAFQIIDAFKNARSAMRVLPFTQWLNALLTQAIEFAPGAKGVVSGVLFMTMTNPSPVRHVT